LNRRLKVFFRKVFFLFLVSSFFFCQYLSFSFSSAYAAGLANSDWPMFGKDLRHTNAVSSDASAYLTMSWYYQLDTSTRAAPIIDENNVIYVGDEGLKLYAIDSNGNPRWAFTAPVAPATHQNIGSAAVDDNGVIYYLANSASGFKSVYALDPDDGSTNWSYPIATNGDNLLGKITIASDGTIMTVPYKSAFTAINSDGTFKCNYGNATVEASGPAVDSSGNIYFGSLTRFYALRSDCTLLWQNTDLTKIRTSPALSADETKIYVLREDPIQLVALNQSDGSVDWYHEFKTGQNWQYSSPSVDEDGIVYVGAAVGTGNGFYAFNSDGTVKWQYEDVNWVRGGSVVGANFVYFADRDRKVYSLDKSSGAFKFSYYTDPPYINNANPPIMDGEGNLYITTTDDIWPADATVGRLLKFRPWTLSASTNHPYHRPGETVTVTATTSMLQTDPTVSENNQVQAIMPNGDEVVLSYDSASGGNTTWTGTWTVPAGTADGSYSGTVEAAAVNVETDTTTNFDSAPTGSSNTGINAAFSYTVDTANPSPFDLISPDHEETVYTSRPTFIWHPASTPDEISGISSYELEVQYQDGGGFIARNIPASSTTTYENEQFRVGYENFGDSDSANDYLHLTTKDSSQWGGNNGLLQEGANIWILNAIDQAGNRRQESRTLFYSASLPFVSTPTPSPALVSIFSPVSTSASTPASLFQAPTSGLTEATFPGEKVVREEKVAREVGLEKGRPEKEKASSWGSFVGAWFGKVKDRFSEAIQSFLELVGSLFH
jgi:outer membrane protein assembly factor BamB